MPRRRALSRSEQRRCRFAAASPTPPPAALSGLPFSPGGYFERLDVEIGLGEQLHQLAVFQLDSLQALSVRHCNTAKLDPQMQNETLLVPAAQFLHWYTGLRLLEEAENLFFGKYFFTAAPLLGKRTLLDLTWCDTGGQVTNAEHQQKRALLKTLTIVIANSATKFT